MVARQKDLMVSMRWKRFLIGILDLGHIQSHQRLHHLKCFLPPKEASQTVSHPNPIASNKSAKNSHQIPKLTLDQDNTTQRNSKDTSLSRNLIPKVASPFLSTREIHWTTSDPSLWIYISNSRHQVSEHTSQNIPWKEYLRVQVLSFLRFKEVLILRKQVKRQVRKLTIIIMDSI